MLLSHDTCKMPFVAAFLSNDSQPAPSLPNPAAVAAPTSLRYSLLSLLVSVLIVAIAISYSESSMWRSKRSSLQEPMTPQEAHDKLKSRGIEYSANSFIESAQKGKTDLISIFLAAGLDPNTRDDSGRTALMTAAGEGNDRAVTLLLARGAAVGLTDHQGTTALHWAARASHSLKCVTALLDHGADVDAKTKKGVTPGGTPLIWAIPVLPPISTIQKTYAPDAIETIKALLNHGADINTRFGGELTPLMRAAAMGNLQIIELLLKRGADVKTVDSEGHTARWFAIQYHHEHAARLIAQADGKIDQSDHRLLAPTHSSNAQPQESKEGEAAEVMRQVVAMYRSLSTYSDKGTSSVHLAGGASTYRVDFETLFKRPGKLRFAWAVEYSNTPGYKQNGVIWSDGATAWSSYSFHGKKPERKKNLEVAVAGAIGASWGTAQMIPRLLSDEVGGIRLDETQGLKMAGNDKADGVECVVVVGYLASGTERRVWVGRKDYLIRRIEERSKNGTREEVRRQIVVDQDIADSRFSQQGI